MAGVKSGGEPDNRGMPWHAFENALMPLRCVFCGVRTCERERYICNGCNEDLGSVESPPPSPPLEFEVTPLAFEFPLDEAIKAFKFRRRLYYGPALAQILCDACEALPDDIDAVLPVPLHWRRRWFRGFNQAREIGAPVARKLGVPIVREVRKRRATPHQSELKYHQRVRNLRAAFVVRGALRYHHVLIVDDVITTGATARELARVLLAAGVAKVSALAIARA